MENEKVKVASETGVIDIENEEDLDNALSNFRLLSENAIPIAPTIGVRFQNLFNEGVEALKPIHEDWKKNIEMFVDSNVKNENYPKENLIRTTVESLLDYTYMRNPSIEISGMTDKDMDLSNVIQKAMTALINKRTLPGINLRPKIIKQILFAHFTNFGVIELTHQDEKGSLEEVIKINKLVQDKIREEKDPELAAPLYELLDILQRELNIRKHIGIGVRIRSPFSLILDPNTEELDLSDCNWVMDRDVMKIDHIKAEYTTYDEENEVYRFKYDNNVLLDFSKPQADNRSSVEQEILNSIMPDVNDEQLKLRTKDVLPVVWVYDRTTRLKYLYMEGKWETPLWVYEDEMGLSRFYPFFLLAFSSPITSLIQQGEVSHYINFQEEINNINRQKTHIRRTAFSKFIYNSAAVDADEVSKLFAQIDSTSYKLEAIGIKLKDADFDDLQKVIQVLKIPTADFEALFDKRDIKDGMDRTTRLSEAMRGLQFRTNTTNDAIDTYNEFANNRLEGLTDKIELSVESLLWSMCELLVSKVKQEHIRQLLSEEDLTLFKNMTVDAFNANYNLIVAAGSTEKPTSSNKKKESFQIMQLIGQIGSSAPMTSFSIIARILRNTFNRTMVTDNDLKTLKQEGQANMQKGISQQQPQQNNTL